MLRSQGFGQKGHKSNGIDKRIMELGIPYFYLHLVFACASCINYPDWRHGGSIMNDEDQVLLESVVDKPMLVARKG